MTFRHGYGGQSKLPVLAKSNDKTENCCDYLEVVKLLTILTGPKVPSHFTK